LLDVQVRCIGRLPMLFVGLVVQRAGDGITGSYSCNTVSAWMVEPEYNEVKANFWRQPLGP
jgi:hypothetical protein